MISRENGLRLKDVKLVHLGDIKTADITKYNTTIVGGASDSDEIDNQIETLKAQLEETDNMHDCERIQERITRLASGIAIIRVGAATEVEMVEKKHRLEDALEAVRAARLDGIVPGGGTALLRAAQQVQLSVPGDQLLGGKIVLQALSAPLRQMAENAGRSPDLAENTVTSALKETGDPMGIDFSTGNMVNMMDQGVIDPVRVTIAALQNAVSVSSSLITTNYAIVETEQ